MHVTKKNGRLEPLAVEKIVKQLKFIIEGTSIDIDVIKSKIVNSLYDGISTTEIQNNIILLTSNNITIDEPDWDLVSGRAYMWDIYGDVYKNTGFRNIVDWKAHIEWMDTNEFYKSEIIDKLKRFNITTEDLLLDNNKVDKIDVTTDYDFNKTRAQVMIDDNKYLIKTHIGKRVEYPYMMDLCNAAVLSNSREELLNNYELLRKNVISLATPFKKNARRRYNANLGSCYIGEYDDNLASIFKSNTDIAFISKYGGGVGWYLSKLRPGNTHGGNVYKSKELNYWVKIVNDIIVAVDQNGTRKGAITVALDWWHLDIYEFLAIKTERASDLRKKAFDIFPQVVLDKYFVTACLEDKEVYLFNHYEARKYIDKDVTELIGDELLDYHNEVAKLIDSGINITHKKIRARALFKEILWTWIEIGDFYITHKDNLNYSNYLKYDSDNYAIAKCGNLCVESFSVSKPATKWVEEVNNGVRVTKETDGLVHSCNLSSINAAELIDKDDTYIENVCKQTVTMLDKSIDVTDAPITEADNTSKLLRNIGVGILGVADYLAYYKVMYNTDDGIYTISKLMDKIAYYCYKASVELAKQYEPYPLFNKDNYSKLIGHEVIELHSKSIDLGNKLNWLELHSDIIKYGIRNFYLLSIAPNTTTGLSMGVTPSFLPAYSLLNYQTLNNMSVITKPKFIKERLWYYKTKFNYDPVDIIKFTEAMQYYVDTGMSMEINLNPDINKNIFSIGNAILEGFNNEQLKAVYYSLTVDNNEKEAACVSCAN